MSLTAPRPHLDRRGALALMAQTAEDLAVIAALVQDAVLTAADMRWDPKARRLVLLLNRFRWEDQTAAQRAGRPYERVRALLILSDVTKIAGQGITKGDADTVLSLLDLTWEPGAECTGRILMTFAGDGAHRVEDRAVIVKRVDAQTRSKTGINELLRD